MNILVLNWQDIRNPLGGGAEVHLHEIFKRVAGQGHSVTLFCSSFPGAKPEEWIDGIRVVREGGRNYFNLLVPYRYRSQFRKEGFDVVVDDINKIPFYTPRFVRGPLIGIAHHWFGKSIFREASIPAALYVHLSEKLAFQVYRRTPMAVVSESTKEEMVLQGFDATNISLVQNAIDSRLYRQLRIKKGRAPLIGYLGRLKRYKSINHLIQAFKLVRESIPKARLWILGDGDARPELEALSKQLGMENSVRFAGMVSDEDKVRMLNQMHVVVNTSIKEGWGLTVVEANACGVPVIASNVPGLRDSVINGKTGWLFEYGNIPELSQKILALLGDRKLQEKMSKEAARWARSFSWDRSAQQMLHAIDRAMASR